MKRFCLIATATAIALSAAAPALAVRCYSVFNVQTGRMETVCVTSSN